MEDALQRLMKECGSTKYVDIANAANRALGESGVNICCTLLRRLTYTYSTMRIPYNLIASDADLLESYTRAPASEYRQAALEAVRQALNGGGSNGGEAAASSSLSGQPCPTRIVAQAVSVLQKMVRDDRFHTRESERPDEEQRCWMSSQVLAAVRGADALGEEHKQEVLKVLLSLSCHVSWTLDGHHMIELMALCLAMYAGSGNATKAAAQATCSQNILEYCKDLSKWFTGP